MYITYVLAQEVNNLIQLDLQFLKILRYKLKPFLSGLVHLFKNLVLSVTNSLEF
jgi:hypothetical protein